MSHKPTGEQQAIVDTAAAGSHLVIEAGAGTGKTSTLKLLATAKPRERGVYLAYNKAIAADAATSFPASVQCRTAHSFAFGAVGVYYKHRLNGPRLPARETARLLNIQDPLRLGNDVPILAPQQLARHVMATVDRFCQSADPQPSRKHVPQLPGFEAPLAHAALADAIVPWAQLAWADIASKTGKLRFTHDAYLKLWQLSAPKLPADYVLLDEAQDSNPAVAAVVDGQTHAQRILVGDRCQAIYGWRGAVDAMAKFDGERLYLSQSFRFGPQIAAEANKWLTLLDAELTLSGYDQIDSRIAPLDNPDVILCRSNGGALTHVFRQIDAGHRVALVGGGDDLRRFAEAALDLMAGQGTAHPDLMAFTRWSEVQDYTQQDQAGSDIKVLVDLIDKHGPAAIIHITGKLSPEDRANLIISTAHKAKGREWRRVHIANDFREPQPGEETGQALIPAGEAMLAYVAVTRAQHILDREGLAWVDRYLPTAPAHPAQPRGCDCMLCDDTTRDRWPAPLPIGGAL